MPLICTLTFAFCIAKGVHYQDASDPGLYGAANLKGRGWTASLSLFSDVIEHKNPIKLSKACDGDICVTYLAHCEGADCHIEIGPFGTQMVDIKAKNAAALRQAMASIAVNLEKPILLTAFTERSPFKSAVCVPLKSDPTSRIARDADGKVMRDKTGRFLRTGFAPVWEPGCEMEDKDFAWQDPPPGP